MTLRLDPKAAALSCPSHVFGDRVDMNPRTIEIAMLLTRRWDAAARCAPIPLRLIVGYGFMEHGFAKLARGPEAFATILHDLGVPGPHFTAWITVLVEVLGGLAVTLGAFVTAA